MKNRHRKQEEKVDLGLRFNDRPLVPFEVDILAPKISAVSTEAVRFHLSVS